MNFDTPPQALTIYGEWNKIFEDTRHKRQARAGLPVCPRVPCAAWGSSPPCRKCTRRRLKEIMQTERIKK